MIWQFDELHGFILYWLLDYGFPNGIYNFCFTILFNNGNLVFIFEYEVGPKGMEELQIYFFLLLLHLKMIISLLFKPNRYYINAQTNK